MTEPQIPISRVPARRRGAARPYILAGALGLVAGLLSLAFAVLRR
jgi:hypothetical protein